MSYSGRPFGDSSPHPNSLPKEREPDAPAPSDSLSPALGREGWGEGAGSHRHNATILVIEISTADGQIAVLRGDDMIFSTRFASQRSHNAQMFAPLRDALAAAGDVLDLIVVGTGPGSYTGVRIAIAAAHGISLSRGAPVIGLASALAPNGLGEAEAFCFVGDARRDSYYVAKIGGADFIEPIQLLPPAEFQSWIEANRALPIVTYEKAVASVEGVQLTSPSAESLARLAQRLNDDQIAKLTSAPIEPIYVRDAFITTPKRAWLQV